MDPDLKRAVERLHGGRASFEESFVMVEEFGSRPSGEDLFQSSILRTTPRRHPSPCLVLSPIERAMERRYRAVLHIPQVGSPEKAVRASIAQATGDIGHEV